MKNPIRNKKIWLVNRDFQYKYAGAGVLAGLASTFITTTLILYPLFVFKILTIGLFLPIPIFGCIAVAMIINCIFQMYFGIRLTHKIAGPIYNLVKHLRIIEIGRWNIEMRQRHDDELHLVVRHFNEMCEGIVKTVESDIECIQKLKAEAQSWQASDPKSKDFQQKLNEVLEELEMRMRTRIANQKEPTI